jgi:hypothetical protein
MIENEGAGPTESLEETSPTSSEAESTETPGQGTGGNAPEILDLDSVQKFRFSGREWTPKDFQGAYMMQADYTRKTQALAEERKFYDNLDTDLASVRQQPALAEKFKEVYPEKFHAYLGYVLPQSQSQNQSQAQPGQSGQKPSLDPEIQKKLGLVDELHSDLQERRIQAAEAQVDAVFQTMGKKYPMADEETVIARAQYFLDQKKQENPKAVITDKDWDNLFKTVHDRNKGKAEAYYSEQVNKQKQANSRGRDIASGGGTPGQAPKVPKTIKEASEYARQELEAT